MTIGEQARSGFTRTSKAKIDALPEHLKALLRENDDSLDALINFASVLAAQHAVPT